MALLLRLPALLGCRRRAERFYETMPGLRLKGKSSVLFVRPMWHHNGRLLGSVLSKRLPHYALGATPSILPGLLESSKNNTSDTSMSCVAWAANHSPH